MESASGAEITPEIGTSHRSESFSFRWRPMGRSERHTMTSGWRPSERHLKEKISLLCDFPISGVISAPDADSIYRVPPLLRKEGLDRELANHLRIDGEPDFSEWNALVERIDAATDPVSIAIVGKYVNLRDAYLSVIEALSHGGFHHGAEVD